MESLWIVVVRALIGQAGLAMVVLLCLAECKAAAGEDKPRANSSKSCVSGECHAAVVKHKYLHGPLQVGQCTVCHAALPGNQHKFKSLETEAALCATCHKPVNTQMNLHDPVAKGRCLKCHDPHGSEEKSEIRISPIARLCGDCHKPVVTRKFAHRPAARGECSACHRAHGSKADNLLDASGSKMCLQCHENMRPATAGGKKIHLAGENCIKCHRAHDSDYAGLLTRPSIELCFGCHKDLREKTEANEYKHTALTKGQGCVGCHRAHSSKLNSLLAKLPIDLCPTCHDDLLSRIDAAKFKHRPVADRSCISCHVPHSSKYKNLLSDEYPPGTSSAWNPLRYAFCFSCHDESIVFDRYTDTITDFRNGRLNLHYLHVNKDRSGLACLTCHAEHASNQPKEIRSDAAFGVWKFPVSFTKNKTGGSCVTACHKEYFYDRVHPAQLSAQ